MASASADHGIHHHITDDAVDDDHSSNKRDQKQEPQELTNNCEYEYEYEYVFEYIDVVWLKRDVRLTDHGPLSEVLTGARTVATQIPMGCNNTTKSPQQKFVILYLYEPDQLREPTVHGSHLRFIHEGLIDMEQQLNEKIMMKTNNKMMKKSMPTSSATSFTSAHAINGDSTATCSNSDDRSATTTNTKSSTTHSANVNDDTTFKYLTVCHNTIISTLESIHFRYSASPSSSSPSPNTSTGAATATAIDTSSTSEKKKKLLKLKYYKISRLLAHEETGHWQSYMRDNDVRKWCKIRSIPFIEYNQTGVTRCLSNRDDYLKKFKLFISKPIHPLKLTSVSVSSSFQSRLFQLDRLPGFLSSPRSIANIFDDNDDEQNSDSDSNSISIGSSILSELLPAHRSDRVGRQQFGGESKAIEVLDSFLFERGATYSKDISSPNTSMNSCSRLSPYITWGHISLRYVFKCLEERRETLRQQKLQGIDIGSTSWLRSLQAFASRIHWRSHFLQKLESEPLLEKQDICSAYQHLRRQPNDWDENKYIAWSTGKTGYPFVDACMRCLIEHGWINFRMRAMLVSFATYNLWLDWKKIAPHLARVFLDYGMLLNNRHFLDVFESVNSSWFTLFIYDSCILLIIKTDVSYIIRSISFCHRTWNTLPTTADASGNKWY
jgi:deoxyribodipyrimidine photolyase